MERQALCAVAVELTRIWAAGSGADRQQQMARLVADRGLAIFDLLALLEIMEGCPPSFAAARRRAAPSAGICGRTGPRQAGHRPS